VSFLYANLSMFNVATLRIDTKIHSPNHVFLPSIIVLYEKE
jgi:hypothetical protein